MNPHPFPPSALSYGWNFDDSGNTRERNSTNSADKRYDTLIRMQKGGTNCTFELAVPNGRYTVYAASGDDGSSGPLAVQWSVANGSDTANFAASHQAATTVTFMAAGQYVLRLTASNASAMVFSDLPVSVNPNPNLL